MAADRQLFLPERQRLARGDAELPFDQILAGNSSVTGCSTWSRVFISMNQMRSGFSPSDASAMNSIVPAPT
jgi:hypothetical protein